MTFSLDEDRIHVESNLSMAFSNCDYIKANEKVEGLVDLESSPPGKGLDFCRWAKLVLLLVALGLLAAAFSKWIGPLLMDKGFMPLINWETTAFRPSVLAAIIFASVALFPSLLLPSSPSMWVAGMSFGYGLGFLLVITASSIGISLPYFIGSLFYYKIQSWLEKYPKKASFLRMAGEGNWFEQFRTVALIRVSPFPYVVYNYCAVVTNVKYGPYLLGSLVGMIPETFLAIYTGILIRAIVDASNSHGLLSTSQIVFNVMGFCGTVVTAVICTMCAKRRLIAMKEQEPLLS